ncbi:MAG: transketolase [Deltaproteobacteria bacterium]|nr:transketolase [Deltaproteobacteria bacterium]
MKKDAMDKLDELCVNTIRMLSVDCVENANSGHPGMPMGAATMAYVLWTRFLRHNPANPEWPDRDRFILSAGHGSMLLYSLLHLSGYDLSLEELKNFRQWGSKTPGHPESHVTAGVETTTGPLGQGFANGVGMAIAERYLGAHFNRPGHEIVNHSIYGIVSDGDLMEGVSHESASLAGHLQLGNIIYFYDDNHITIDGSTELSFTEDRIERFKAYGWHVQRVEDGNDVEGIEAAIRAAQTEKVRPSLVSVRTHIGYGSPQKQDTSSAHGEPLGAEEIKLTKENLGWPVDPAFFIPDEARNHFRQALEKGKILEKEWTDRFESYEKSYPELALQWKQWIKGELPEGWDKRLPSFPADAKGSATRGVSGIILNAVAPILPNLIGGSADLAPSNKTFIKGEEVFQSGRFRGRNFHFGVREHGMGSIMNGMALHGGLIPYGGTFLVFADYMRPAIRLAAMMELKVIFVFTHDSIGLGEDGPTHQPVEHLAALRAIPNLTVLRPCDANETVEAWRFALEQKDGPVALALTRQSIPVLDREASSSADGLHYGGYVLRDFTEGGDPDVILIGTGSEVHIAMEAADALHEKGIHVRVVSMPSWELFDKQSEAYQNRILPAEVKARVAVEAGITQGWHRYIGEEGEFVGIDHFGASAPYKTLYEKFGLTADRVVEKALGLLE